MQTDFLTRKEELICIFHGPFKPSFILPLQQPPLFVCIINKYAHRVEVLLQLFQALEHGPRRDLQREAEKFIEISGSAPSIAFHFGTAAAFSSLGTCNCCVLQHEAEEFIEISRSVPSITFHLVTRSFKSWYADRDFFRNW